MTDIYAHVTVRILEKEYQVSCPAEERADLLDSAELLNRQMREIRDSGKVVGLDRIAVMAALNMANELLQTRNRDESLESSLGKRIKSMAARIDSAIGSDGRQLEL
ncbi:MAG: cell division protein ZapA [Pseudomonadota bacterium]